MTTRLEEWRPVVGHEGWYEVSDHGRVRRVRPATATRIGYILNPYVWHGYRYVRLQQDGVKYVCRVHRLVLAAFCGPCPPQHEANHKNGNKADNRPDNLEWITRSENMIHAWAIGLQTYNGKRKEEAER